MKNSLLLLPLVLLALIFVSRSTLHAQTAAPAPAPTATVYLVRHAEKEKEGADPALTAAGRARSQALVEALRAAGIEHVHSTDYTRTRDTAAPIASALKLDVEMYDPRDLPGLARTVRTTGGRHLIVGHSNTTHSAVRALGGEAGPPIDEPGEYDRIYIVTIEADGTARTVRTVRLRYGAASAN